MGRRALVTRRVCKECGASVSAKRPARPHACGQCAALQQDLARTEAGMPDRSYERRPSKDVARSFAWRSKTMEQTTPKFLRSLEEISKARPILVHGAWYDRPERAPKDGAVQPVLDVYMYDSELHSINAATGQLEVTRTRVPDSVVEALRAGVERFARENALRPTAEEIRRPPPMPPMPLPPPPPPDALMVIDVPPPPMPPVPESAEPVPLDMASLYTVLPESPTRWGL